MSPPSSPVTPVEVVVVGGGGGGGNLNIYGIYGGTMLSQTPKGNEKAQASEVGAKINKHKVTCQLLYLERKVQLS